MLAYLYVLQILTVTIKHGNHKVHNYCHVNNKNLSSNRPIFEFDYLEIGEM